jgi:hypothetical protein
MKLIIRYFASSSYTSFNDNYLRKLLTNGNTKLNISHDYDINKLTIYRR